MSEVKHFRRSMASLHTWVGLLLSWVLYFIFVTGTIGYFDNEIDTWTRPELTPQTISTVAAVDGAVNRLSQVAANADRWFIGLPNSRDYHHLIIAWRYHSPPDGMEPEGKEFLNTDTMQPIDVRDTGGGQTLYRMHYNLHYMPSLWANYIVGIAAMLMLLAIVTGIVIHAKLFRDFFTFRPHKKQRSWLDMHNLLSVLALPFHIMITYSGLLFFVLAYMPLIVLATYGAGSESQKKMMDELFPRETVIKAEQAAPLVSITPLLKKAWDEWGEEGIKSIRVEYPGDANATIIINTHLDSLHRLADNMVFDGTSGRLKHTEGDTEKTAISVYFTLLGLHEGNFADITLRWLYFFSGLMGTAMIASGLILWSIKREKRREFGEIQPKGHRLVEILNIGTVTGLAIGVAGFFLANRLLPLQMESRAEWEIHILFCLWLTMLAYASLRPSSQAWGESLWLCALAFWLVPVVNAMTTDRNLINSLINQDWIYVGVDMVMLLMGSCFTGAAWIKQKSINI